jgi:hypothetical protein
MADQPPDRETTPSDGSQTDAATADRRGGDRRKSVIDTRTTGFERRRGPGRRRSDFLKAADEGELTDEQFLFIKAIDAFKRANQKTYPSWTDVLEVIRKLGYRKTAAMSVDLPGIEDWTESAEAPAFPQKSPEDGSADAGEETDSEDTDNVGVSYDDVFENP